MKCIIGVIIVFILACKSEYKKPEKEPGPKKEFSLRDSTDKPSKTKDSIERRDTVLEMEAQLR